MPDRRKHRGRHPEDERLFAADRLDSLRRAVTDYSWLLSNGYALHSSLKLVGDRYELTARQRMAVRRCGCTDEALDRRKSRRVELRAVAGQSLAVDGYNLLITVESALGGGVILVGRDGYFRDLASIHGTYRKVEETQPAVVLIMDALATLSPRRVDWFLDRPVANSGRLRTLILEQFSKCARVADRVAEWHVQLIHSPDKVLREFDGIVATTDSAVLDVCNRWLNLAAAIIRSRIPQERIIHQNLPPNT